MPVTVDRETLETEEMGLQTVGQVLSHLQKANRLVVHVLIDGQEPDLSQLPAVRQKPLSGHTLFIETAEPKKMALDILGEVESQLQAADALKNEAADLLVKNQNVKAMEKLSGCFSVWQHVQESIVGVGQILKLDLNSVQVRGQGLKEVLAEFAGQLKQIKIALENRDFVTLSDLLLYETSETTSKWRGAIKALRTIIG
jgi:hypothetical protein